MDLRFTEAEESFRREVREFFQKELPPDWGGMDHFAATDKQHAYGLEFDRKLGKRGWLTMAWPKEYGGQGRSHLEQLVFNEEKGYYRVPSGGMHGVHLVGPTLMIHGTEAQKKEHLGKIARAEMIWCQGFSEPEAGSDLASLQCRAIEDGDDYVITGQKLWTTNAHYADWCIVLARSDPKAPKHRGISFFLVDMLSPGVAVMPVWIMSGGRVNQTFFDNVRVPKRNLVGEKNKGWYIAMTTLGFERSGIERIGQAWRTLEELIEYTREKRDNGGTLAQNPLVRYKLAEMALEIRVGRMLAYRVAWLQNKGEVPQYEASISKAYSTELLQRLANTGLHVLGLYGPLQEDSKWTALRGRFEHGYRATISGTILAGTSEIQRLIIATRGLGLPRE